MKFILEIDGEGAVQIGDLRLLLRDAISEFIRVREGDYINQRYADQSVEFRQRKRESVAHRKALAERLLAASVEAVDGPLDSDAAYKELEATVRKYRDYGAGDSEGWHAIRDVEYAAAEGKPFPLKGPNPFQIYESLSGWQAASCQLVAAAVIYWKALVQKRLGTPIA